MMSEVYHEDKGFDDRASVFLSEEPPNQQTVLMLSRHRHASKMKYLQGSAFVTEVCSCTSGHAMLDAFSSLYI